MFNTYSARQIGIWRTNCYTESPPKTTIQKIEISIPTSITPTDRLITDKIIVGILRFSNFFALTMPKTPTGIPVQKNKPLPLIPTISNNPNQKLEFRIFVGVILHQPIKGINITNINSIQNINRVAFFAFSISAASAVQVCVVSSFFYLSIRYLTNVIIP